MMKILTIITIETQASSVVATIFSRAKADASASALWPIVIHIAKVNAVPPFFTLGFNQEMMPTDDTNLFTTTSN